MNALARRSAMPVPGTASGPATGSEWTRSVNQSSAVVTRFGYGIILLAFAGFGVWAITAPLGGAVIAPGVIAAAGQNVQIQHLEGGIVSSIEVDDGNRVHQGDPLIILDDTTVMVNLNRLEKQSMGLEARLLRLRVERDGGNELVVPDTLAFRDNPVFKEAFQDQLNEFVARLNRYKTELSIMSQRASALEANMTGLEAQKKSITDQLSVVSEEMNRKKDLLNRGLTNRSEYTALLRSEADLIGKIGELESQLASTRVQIVEAREQSERVTTQRLETAVAELTESRLKLDDTLEQLNGVQAILKRTVIRSPVDGIVVKMEVNATGSVIAPGKPLIEILPTSDKLLVEARLNPRDIDMVKVGQEAKLRFSALNARITPEYPGTVTYISADRIIDPSDQSSYFIARLTIDADAASSLAREQIYPGMPVESFIATQERTFAEYLLKPLSDSVNRAFREE